MVVLLSSWWGLADFVLHHEVVDVVTEVNQVEEAVGGDLMPDGVTLVVLAMGLTWVDVLGKVHICVSLRESRKAISEHVNFWDEVTTNKDGRG